MRKITLLAALFFIPLFTAPGIFAQESTVSAEQAWAETGEIYTPKILPNNVFYFLKSWKERVEIFFANTPDRKAAKRLEFATRRLAEIKSIIKDDPALVEQLTNRYQEQVRLTLQEAEQVREQSRERLMEHVGEVTLKHQQVLLGVYQSAPESAQKGLQNALDQSMRGHNQAVQSVSKDKKQNQKGKEE